MVQKKTNMEMALSLLKSFHEGGVTDGEFQKLKELGVLHEFVSAIKYAGKFTRRKDGAQEFLRRLYYAYVYTHSGWKDLPKEILEYLEKEGFCHRGGPISKGARVAIRRYVFSNKFRPPRLSR